MGRKVGFSAVIMAGLVQMTPAIAQIEDRQDDWGRTPPPAAQAEARVATAAETTPASREGQLTQAEDVAEASSEPAPVTEARSAPQTEVLVAKVEAREPDLADKDLAVAPPEEMRPVLVDPTAQRRTLAAARSVSRPQADPRAEADLAAARRPVPAERVAAAPSHPAADQPAPVYADREPIAAPAERVAAAQERPLPVYRDARPDRGGQYRTDAPTNADEAAEPSTDQREQYRRAASAAMERATHAADMAQMADAPPTPGERAPAARPVYAAEDSYPAVERAGQEAAARPLPARRPVYADRRDPYPAYPTYPAEEAGEPGYGEREMAPVYAEADRRAPAGDPRQEPSFPPGYEDDAVETEQDYALAERAYREPPLRGASYGRSWEQRGDARICGSDRADRLQQRLRRDIADRRIDWRTARDLEAEIGHAEEMQRSYCSSGLNAWREDRLDRQYAQIEDRLRYEESRGGWR